MVKIRLRRIGAKGRPFYRVVVAESKNFKGFQDVMTLAGVDVKDYHEPRCEHMMGEFIQNNPSLWNEDIGE